MPRFDPTHNYYKQRNEKFVISTNEIKPNCTYQHSIPIRSTVLRCVLGLFRALHTASIMGWIVLNTKVAVSVIYWCITQQKLVPVLILKNINFSSNCFNQIMSRLVTRSYCSRLNRPAGGLIVLVLVAMTVDKAQHQGDQSLYLLSPSCSFKTSCSQGYHSPLIVLMEGQHLSILFVFFFSISLAPCV